MTVAESSVPDVRHGWIGTLLLGAAALAWGLAMAPRGYAEGDGSELTLAMAVAGVPHPTGYPLYVLGGHLFGSLLHAVGVPWPIAANAWSALGGAVAIVLLHRLARALTGDPVGVGGPWRALLAFLAFGTLLVQPIWSAAVTGAEVYAWHVAWIGAACGAAWRIADAATHAVRRQAGPPPRRRAFFWGMLVGAGAAHHATSIFVWGPLTGWLVARGALGARRRFLLPFLAGTLVPLSSIAWIAYRAGHPAAFQWPLLEGGIAGLWTHVSGRAYFGYLGGFHASAQDTALLLTTLPWLAVALPALGLSALARDARTERSFARVLLLAFVLQATFVMLFRVRDPAAHALPLLALGAVWLPRGLARLAARAGPAAATLLLVAGMLAVLPGWIARDDAGRRAAEKTDRVVRRAWELVPFERGIVAWNNDLLPRLRAYQLLEGSHPDRVVVHPGMLSWEAPRRRFRERHGFDPFGGSLPEREEHLSGRLGRAVAAAGVPYQDFDEVVRLALE